MARKPVTQLRDAVKALAAIEDATERTKAAGEFTDAMREEATPQVAAIRQDGIKQMRGAGMSYRAIGDLLGIHFTRVKQLEVGESTGKWKRAATKPAEPDDAEA